MRGRGDRDDLVRRLSEAEARASDLELKLRAIEESDSVTGLMSLRRFRAALEIETDRSRRHGRSLAMAVIDVDGFRAINAREGHTAGDEVLAAVARVLREHTRNHDVVSRTAADEFAILMPETDTVGAQQCCERVLVALETTHTAVVEQIDISAGIAAFERTQTPAALFGAANTALDRARAEGGGKVVTGQGPTGVVSNDQRDAVSALAVALLERDEYTGDHSDEVMALVENVARGLGLNDEEVERVKAAAKLHDIGKVAIPDDILNKPGKLTDEEWKVMKDHTVVGERILRAIPGMGGVARIVRHEHERWDGGGYPDAISGPEIPIGARIILACDAYHAMTSDRPYRKSMGHSEAIRELHEGAGTQFDPAVIEVLVGALYGTRQSGGNSHAAAEPHAAPQPSR